MNERSWSRPLPLLGADNEFFWTSGADGVLRLLRCQDCGYYVHPPSPRCPECLGGHLAVESVSGRARLFSYTVNYQPWMPNAPIPYVIGLVELDEQAGLRLTTNIVGCAVDEVEIGMDLAVVFEHHEDVWLPMFRPQSSPP
jgi:uncharacterized OB-fold protein